MWERDVGGRGDEKGRERKPKDVNLPIKKKKK